MVAASRDEDIKAASERPRGRSGLKSLIGLRLNGLYRLGGDFLYSHVTHVTHVTHRPHKGRRPYPQYPKSEAYPTITQQHLDSSTSLRFAQNDPQGLQIFRLRSAPLNMTQRGYRCFDCAALRST